MWLIGWLSALSVGDWLAIFSAAGGAAAGTPTVYKKIKASRRRRRFRFLLPKASVRILIPSRNVNRARAVVAQEDQQAAERIKKLLESNAFKAEIEYIPPGGAFSLSNHHSHVVICGPKNSPIIEETFKSLPYLEFKRIRSTGWAFVDRATKNIYSSPMDRSPPEEGDIAFFGKLALPSMPDPEIILICGIHAFGSMGAAAFLEDDPKRDAILSETRGKRFFTLIRSRHNREKFNIIEYDVFLSPRTLP